MKKAQFATICVVVSGILMSCAFLTARMTAGHHHWIPRQWEVHHREVARGFNEVFEGYEYRFAPKLG
jgi:hypothetical protein